MNYSNFTEMFKNPIDMSQAMSSSRRHVEAASEASQMIVGSVQEIARRQSEIAREQVEHALKASKDLFTSGTPETNIAKQTDFAKASFESSLNNLREISEMFVKSAFAAFDVLNNSVSESLSEIGKPATASKKKAS